LPPGQWLSAGQGVMLIFEGTITFEPDGSAVIWASAPGGKRVKVSVTRSYAEKTWRIRYSEEEITTQIWLHIDELREAAARECANGKTELVL
jgi:hypothetical protein